MKTLAIFAAAAVLATCAAAGETVTAGPDALLDYIEATGSQYIDTGVNAETGLKASIDFAWADEDLSGVDWSLLDACTPASSNNNRSRFFMCHMLNGKPFFAYGLKQRKNPAGAVPFVGGERCTIVTDMSSTNSLELTQNGLNTFDAVDRETFATNGNVNLSLNLFVFATNYGGSPYWKGQGKLYELKIFRKNATTDEFDLLRHYIPCIKDNRAGLYDKVNGTISFSSADFIAGSVTNAAVTVTKFNQSYPYSGKAAVEYTVGGTLPANAGMTVRPVRGFVEDSSADGIVTYDPVVAVIESVDDWNALSAAIADGSIPTERATLRLANDIGPVTTMIGTAAHPFSGAFDGGTNTLTLALSGTDDFIAPFSCISGATITDLKVAGTVAGGMHCSGLVGNVVVKTPPIVNLEGFAISVVESSDVAGKTVTETKPLNSKGRTNFAIGSAPSRFYRLSATTEDAQ